jgi:hypothetical protein
MCSDAVVSELGIKTNLIRILYQFLRKAAFDNRMDAERFRWRYLKDAYHIQQAGIADDL